MSAIYQAQINQLNADIASLKERLSALMYIKEVIQNEDAFVHEERAQVNTEISNCEKEVEDKTVMLQEQTRHFEGVVKKCEAQIKQRELILNRIFADPRCKNVGSLMPIFSEQHIRLQKRLEN